MNSDVIKYREELEIQTRRFYLSSYLEEILKTFDAVVVDLNLGELLYRSIVDSLGTATQFVEEYIEERGLKPNATL